MHIEQIYTGCLAQGAYYIESNGEVAIIDPLREVQPYIDRAANDNAQIKYIFETHFHADFVSGHVTLAEKTGAKIIYGPGAETSFDSENAKDGQVYQLGNIEIIALHTPGHTLESTTFLLRDENGKDHAIFTGDTLFLGDVGRPDLAQKIGSITTEDLAGMLFDSLRTKIMPLADDILVYPAHGAGSACGKNMMKETVDTLGNQKKMNYALRSDMTKDEFIKELTDGLLPPPAYFPLNVKLNKEGYEDVDTIVLNSNAGLSPKEVNTIVNETDTIILDVRHQNDFTNGHVPRSIFIGLHGDFAPWVGALIKDVHQKIILVVDEEKLEEAIIRLSRVGFDNVLGFLKGGIEAWKEAGYEVDTISNLTADQMKAELGVEKQSYVLDVRKESEFLSEHVLSAHNAPLTSINDFLASFPSDQDMLVHCAGGYRSVIASSILKARGVHNIQNVLGGFKAIKEAGIVVSDYVCPSTL